MRKLGIDYGTKKIGLALTDDQGLMAFPHEVWPNDADFVRKLVALIEEKAVGEVVIGESLGRDGQPNPVHAAVQELVTDLTLHVGLPVHLEPEQYTSREAERFQGKTDKSDAAAAAIILNSFITRQQNAQ